MTKTGWIKAGLATGLVALGGGVVLLETGVLVRWTATHSDWQPTPMADLEMECGARSTPIPWTYCVHRTPGSTSGDLVVHLHGRRGTARWWNDSTYYTGALYERWEEAGTPAPTVVSVSFGPLWVLLGETGFAFDAVLEDATASAAAWAGHDFERTMVVGESMGGYNALLAGLHHPERFERVAALCPPLSTESPFGSGAIERMGESSLREAFMLLAFSRAFFDDDAHWRRSDPLARILGGEAFEPTLHLSCGTDDPWGCADGAQALHDAVQAAGGASELELLPEGHCAIDEAALADFLTEPG
ncbi:MAG: alpha/beta hydrolase-fold protein [Nannocystaceae bacterium]|nr:alpha/beta hydrolase-fold protein [bacterium]